ncbi:MAG TPA: LamG domain-containing protein [Nannocystaceae bacterium]|nr:LamG domain-containing protein [Nannocystaceae bacterium]
MGRGAQRYGAGLLLVLCACMRNQTFVCDNDAQCVAGNGVGQCEADRHCSYPDADCESGRRYGEWAGERSGQCVAEGVASTGGSSSSGAVAETSTSVGATTNATTVTTAMESSTGTSDPGTSTSGAGSSESTGTHPIVPLGHWPLDEGRGAIVYDMGSAGHDGVLEGAMWIAGPDGSGALRFPAEDDGVDIGAYEEYDLVDAPGLSVMGWAKFDDFVIANVSIIAKFGSFALQFWGNDDLTGAHPVISLYPEGATGDGDTDGPVNQYGSVYCSTTDLLLVNPPSDAENLGLWHHYAATYDVGTRMLRLYVDGTMVCEEDVSSGMLDGTILVTTTRLQLGRWQTSGPTLLGAIDDVRIYDQMLSSEDVAAIAASR